MVYVLVVLGSPGAYDEFEEHESTSLLLDSESSVKKKLVYGRAMFSRTLQVM